VKRKVHQLQEKQVDSHKVCWECHEHKHVIRRSNASSIRVRSNPRHTCSEWLFT